jgi:alpha-1,2-mannosyltransferase
MSSDLAVTATSTRDVAAVDTGTRRWPRRALAASWLVALPLVFLGYGLAGWLRGWALGADSSVYRAGAALLLHGHSPYVVSDLGYLHLSFTYPPAAALLFTPLAALPAQLAWAVIAAASALALALAIRVAIAAVPYWRFPAAWSTPLLTAAMLCLVPVWRTIALGQVNVLLMAMVAVDVLAVTARGSRWGGLLTGVAAAVKLVPLIFIPHLLLTGKRTASARALAVFAGLQGLTLAIAPRDSAYWTSYVLQTGRIGAAGDRGGPVVRARRMARRRRARGSRAAAGAPLPPPRAGRGSSVRDRVLRAAAGAGFLDAMLGVDSTGPDNAVFLAAGHVA